MRKKPATVRIARWSATHPWSAIGLWVVFVAACLVLGGAAGTNSISDEESGVRESGRAGKIVHSGDFPEKAEENVLITAEDGGALVFVGAYVPYLGAFLSGAVAVLVALADRG
ncbi:hypothetical protein ACWDVV_25720, partial [Streptomyces tendae]